MFIFYKRTSVSWEHYNGINKVGFGDGIPIFDHTANTFIFQTPNGKNYPKEAVLVNADLKIIDQTNANVEYTFLTSVSLENKLIELGYPFINVGPAGSVAGVASFKGRTGAVTPQTGDYLSTDLTDFNSATRAQTEAELVAGTNITITPSGSGATRQLTIASTGGGGATNLDYTPGATQGIVTSDTGTDATIPLADGTNAGLSENNLTDAEKTAITHSNRSILDLITEAFTSALKTSYDNAVTWISTNGTNLLNHLASTSNPHSVTQSQVGLSEVNNTSDVDKPISTATQTALDDKSNVGHTHVLSDITQSGASTGNVPVWDGTNWVAQTPSVGLTEQQILTRIFIN